MAYGRASSAVDASLSYASMAYGRASSALDASLSYASMAYGRASSALDVRRGAQGLDLLRDKGLRPIVNGLNFIV
jgi:hypothetical protein